MTMIKNPTTVFCQNSDVINQEILEDIISESEEIPSGAPVEFGLSPELQTIEVPPTTYYTFPTVLKLSESRFFLHWIQNNGDFYGKVVDISSDGSLTFGTATRLSSISGNNEGYRCVVKSAENRVTVASVTATSQLCMYSLEISADGTITLGTLLYLSMTNVANGVSMDVADEQSGVLVTPNRSSYSGSAYGFSLSGLVITLDTSRVVYLTEVSSHNGLRIRFVGNGRYILFGYTSTTPPNTSLSTSSNFYFAQIVSIDGANMSVSTKVWIGAAGDRNGVLYDIHPLPGAAIAETAAALDYRYSSSAIYANTILQNIYVKISGQSLSVAIGWARTDYRVIRQGFDFDHDETFIGLTPMIAQMFYPPSGTSNRNIDISIGNSVEVQKTVTVTATTVRILKMGKYVVLLYFYSDYLYVTVYELVIRPAKLTVSGVALDDISPTNAGKVAILGPVVAEE